MRRTKIVCTLGPATRKPAVFEQLLTAGVEVVRLNLSHGTIAEHEENIRMVRNCAARLDAKVAVLLDNKGPEIRIGTFKGGSVNLQQGSKFTISTRKVVGDAQKVSIAYPQLPLVIEKGTHILLNDGLIELIVERTTDETIICTVVNGGELSDRKKLNIPGLRLDIPYLDAEDLRHLDFAAAMDVDFIACSFVRDADDISQVRNYLQEHDAADIQLIAKIENQLAIEHLEAIIAAADGVMVARGDLGVEIPVENVPFLQKRIINLCNAAGKPVITATQMLESMVHNPRPTRAEVSDVANAILDGTDAVMLSGETAQGDYPVETVQMMRKVIDRTEQDINEPAPQTNIKGRGTVTVTDAVSHAAAMITAELRVSAIITPTSSGYTARMIAKYHPKVPVIAIVTNEKVLRRMLLVQGVIPVMTTAYQSTDEMIEAAKAAAAAAGLVKPGELVAITAGIPVGVTGTTNLFKIDRIGKK